MTFTILEVSLAIVGASTVVWGWLEYKKRPRRIFRGEVIMEDHYLDNFNRYLKSISESLQTIASSLSSSKKADGEAIIEAIEEHLKNLDQRIDSPGGKKQFVPEDAGDKPRSDY